MSKIVRTTEKAEAGYFLLEAVIAILLLGLGLGVLFPAVGQVLQDEEATRSKLVATIHANSVLAKAGVTNPLKVGQSSGQLPDGWEWTSQVSIIGTTTENPVLNLKLMTVDISITDVKGRVATTLKTNRLVHNNTGLVP